MELCGYRSEIWFLAGVNVNNYIITWIVLRVGEGSEDCYGECLKF